MCLNYSSTLLGVLPSGDVSGPRAIGWTTLVDERDPNIIFTAQRDGW